MTGNVEGQWALKHQHLYSLSEQGKESHINIVIQCVCIFMFCWAYFNMKWYVLIFIIESNRKSDGGFHGHLNFIFHLLSVCVY